MYRTILLALPALLLLAACADDVTTPAEPADTLAGQPVRFTATGLTVTPAGVTQTKADADFSDMTVYMTDTDGNTWQADYENINGTWKAVGTPLYWPTSTDQYTFTAISPAGTDPHITLPTEWTEGDLTKHEAIRATCEASTVTPSMSPVSLTLRPALTKVQVVSISSQPVYLIDAPTAGTLNLTGSTTGNAATGIMTLYSPEEDGLTYEGYVLPAGTSGFGFMTNNVYMVSMELKAGTVVTTCDDTDAALITCTEPGGLTWPENAPGKVVITGTLNAQDMKTIISHKDEIVELYVMAGANDSNSWNDLKMSSGVSKLQSVYLAEATSIGNNAFIGCGALASVSLPQATSIKHDAFQNCTQLASVSLPKAESIGNNAFLGCTQLASVSLPQATSIGSLAFTGCSKLASVSLPQATSIEMWAFENCEQLASICLPKDANIGNEAFKDCNKLTTLFLSDEGTTEDEAQAFKDKISTLTTIHYGYIGTDGDYLDENNYSGHWSSN